MPQSHLTDILHQINTFPALPLTVTRVLDITSRPESSASDLMEAVLPDQSMCAAILKIANSAFFGRPRQVCSIEEAVVVLGFAEIRHIILTQAIFNSFHQLKGATIQEIEELWQHSLTCAITARIIAAGTSDYKPNELFIAGLIHDIGKLPMIMALPGIYSPEMNHPGQIHSALFPDEIEKFGISHEQSGLRLLNRWLFPEPLCVAVGYHHSSQNAPTDIAFPLIVQMANILSHVIHPNSEKPDGNEILQMIHDFIPEVLPLWRRFDFSWTAVDIDNWLSQLQAALSEGSCLDLFDE